MGLSEDYLGDATWCESPVAAEEIRVIRVLFCVPSRL